MDKKRLVNEILMLQQDHPVHYDLSEGIVDVGVEMPSGWSEDKSVIRFDVSDTHPREPPSTHIRSHLNYRGTEPRILRYCAMDGWYELCIHTDWDPDQHTLATRLRLAMTGLSYPTKSNPFQRATR